MAKRTRNSKTMHMPLNPIMPKGYSMSERKRLREFEKRIMQNSRNKEDKTE